MLLQRSKWYALTGSRKTEVFDTQHKKEVVQCGAESLLTYLENDQELIPVFWTFATCLSGIETERLVLGTWVSGKLLEVFLWFLSILFIHDRVYFVWQH